jgi:hypothetical protein
MAQVLAEDPRNSVDARVAVLVTSRPCPRRALSSGHERYPADSHGHFKEAAGLAARP